MTPLSPRAAKPASVSFPPEFVAAVEAALRAAPQGPPLVYRLTPAARAIAMNPAELRGLLRDRVIAGYRTDGGHWRIPRESLQNYIAQRCEQEQGEAAVASGRGGEVRP